jgi:aryl-alcohol dehydrogenase-like predicted oxidoreductase
MEMQYRRLGQAGIKVSVLSFGSWVTFAKQLPLDTALACMQAAHEAGVNFFDNAEAYEKGESEKLTPASCAACMQARAVSKGSCLAKVTQDPKDKTLTLIPA